ncbi:MAG: tRNA (guanosine(46)-N7)-methyltransferase TrmB [Oceanospirillaceae bacterium]|nr:tRNA (guanosine(46)-N7)-methyltransferase TrmB [Oceanospirillaceae bacterium]
MTEQKQHLRTIRSFVMRAGRTTLGQERALTEIWPIFGLTVADGLIDFEQIFGREAETVLEIGFGMGDSLISMAKAAPQQNFIGIEVHRPGVGRLLSRIGEENLSNIRVYSEDAIDVLANCIPDGELHALQLFFPDPWHKKKHHKRRIVQADFAQVIKLKLAVGGSFHMATDWQNYAEYMMEVMEAAPGFRNIAGSGIFSPQPQWRPVTKFQRRGEKLGHGVWDLIYQRDA